MSEKTEIVGGPSREELHKAFSFYESESGRRMPVSFRVRGALVEGNEGIFKVLINALSWEEGSGNAWCFAGVVCADAPLPFETRRQAKFNVRGFFNSHARKGWIELA